MSDNRLAAGGAALRRIGALLLAAALAGVLVAGLVLPFAGLTGFTARQVSDGIQNLPSELEKGAIPHTTKVYDANGNQIARFYDENREEVALNDVAPIMRKAIVAIEDSRFFEHGAIDIEGTSRALINNLLGNDTQGGSSITQQLIKLILIEQADTKRADGRGHRAELRPQDARAAVRDVLRAEPQQGRDPRGLPQHRVLRRRRLRHQGRGAALLLGQARPSCRWRSRRCWPGWCRTRPGSTRPSTPTSRSSARNVVLQRMAELDIVTPSTRRAHRDARAAQPRHHRASATAA